MTKHNEKEIIEKAIINFEKQKEKYFYYSPINFLRNIKSELILVKTVFNPIFDDLKNGENKIINIIVENKNNYFIYKELEWDTRYFGKKTYKLLLVINECENLNVLSKAIGKFTDYLLNDGMEHCFLYVPCEDLKLIQALGMSKYKLIETRLTYYGEDVQNFENERFKVRNAKDSDIENLVNIATQNINHFDRVHADPAIDNIKADKYVGEYVKQSVLGYADLVIVPNEPETPPDAFLTGNYQKELWDQINCNVSSTTCKG